MTVVWVELLAMLLADAYNSLLRRPLHCQVYCQMIQVWWNVTREAPGDKNYVRSQSGHHPSYCNEYIFSRWVAGKLRDKERNLVRWRETTRKLFCCCDTFSGPIKMWQIVAASFHIFCSIVHFAWVLSVPKFMPTKWLSAEQFPVLVLPHDVWNCDKQLGSEQVSVFLQGTRDNSQHKKHRLNRQNKKTTKQTNQPAAITTRQHRFKVISVLKLF